jgi:hypothetical protein
VTRVTVYAYPPWNWNVAPVQLEPHALLMAMLTVPNPFGGIEAGYIPPESVAQLNLAY